MQLQAAFMALALLATPLQLVCAQTADDAAQPSSSMFLGNAAHSPVAATNIQVPISLNWKCSTSEGGQQTLQHLVSSPALDETSVYFFVGQRMYAADRVTGSMKWEKPLEVGGIVDATPVITGGKAIFGCRDGRVYFVDTKTGVKTGEFNTVAKHKGAAKPPPDASTSANVQSSPLYHDGKIYVGTDNGWVYALDFESGERIWQFRTKGAVKATPAYWNHGVFVASLDGHVYGLQADTGRLMWRTTLDNKDLLASPVVSNAKVIVAAGKYLYACDHGGNGYVRWRFEAKGSIVGAPVVYQDRVFFGDTDGNFYCLASGADGNFSYWEAAESRWILWMIPTESDGSKPKDEVAVEGMYKGVRSSPVVVGNAIIYRSGARQLAAYSLDGDLLWTYSLAEAAALPMETIDAGRVSVQLRQAAEAAAAAGGTAPTVSPDAAASIPPIPTSVGGILAAAGAGAPEAIDSSTAGGAGGAGGVAGAGTSRFGSRGRGDSGGTRSGRSTGGTRGGQDGVSVYERRQMIVPTMTFENDAASGMVAQGDELFVLGDDAALYAFSVSAADAVAPFFDQASITVPAQSGTAAQDVALSTDPSSTPEPSGNKLPGAPPVQVRVRIIDEGSGINPQSLTVAQRQGGDGVTWESSYDAEGGYVQAKYAPSGGVAKNMPDGDYVLVFSVSDWSGNEGTATVAFAIDNAAQAPSGRGGWERGGGMPGGGMPGMPGGGMPGMPGGGMPGMPGGGMPGMPGGGMPGMPGGGMPGMPGGGMPGMPGGGMPGMPGGGMPGMPGGGMPGMPGGGMPGMPGGGMPGMPGMP